MKEVYAVIAARGGAGAKSRFAGRLASAEREALVEAMLADMLDSLSRCAALAGTVVVTPTASLARNAEDHGARVCLEADAKGVNAALNAGRAMLAPDAFAILLPGDLPLISPADMEALVEAAADDRVLLAPAVFDGGTAAVALRADAPFELRFGADSFARHVASAKESGLAPVVMELASLGLDLDGAEDLDRFLAAHPTGAAARLVGRLAPPKYRRTA